MNASFILQFVDNFYKQSQYKLKEFVGTCVNSFDENGNCVIDDLLPWADITEFAKNEEAATQISKDEFIDNVILPPNFQLYRNCLYFIINNIYVMYNDKQDIHYFFT